MKNVRSSQPCISMNFFSKAQFLPCEYHPFRGAVSNGAPTEQLTYNFDHHILKLNNILVQVQFTTSKMKRDVYYSKLGIPVAP